MTARANDSSPASSQLQPKAGRRVAFSAVASRDRDDSCVQRIRRIDESNEPRCFACCAWACLGVLVILVVGLLLACSLVFFLQSELPRIHVERCALGSVNVTRTQINGKPMILTNLGTEVLLNVTNKNDKVAISFGALKVNVSWEDIGLGQARFPGLSQDPKVARKLKISTQVTNVTMNKDDVDQLQKEMKERNTVLTVVVSGTVGFHLGWLQLQRLPLLIRCSEIRQAALELGQDYTCGVRIYAFS